MRTAIPKTPSAPWEATGIAASPLGVAGGAVPAPSTPQRTAAASAASWNDWSATPSHHHLHRVFRHLTRSP
eukprot:10928802-Prorocentrum_lima.AAC.1